MVAMLVGLSSQAWASQDPTAPLGWQAPVKKKPVVRARLPQLQAIVCGGPGGCVAILNGVSVAPGERVNGYTLAEIRDGSVIVSRGGRQWRLELFADDIKTNE